MKLSVLKVLFVLLLGIMPYLSYAEIPGTISFQGYLSDDAGAPINGPTEIAFAIPGTDWNEYHPSVLVNQGVFSVVLGNQVSLAAIDFGQVLQLHIAVNGISQSIPISSVPYAFRAKTVEYDSDTLKTLFCASGQVTEWNGSNWVCADKASGLQGLKGDKGEPGSQGVAGPAGVQGPKGDGPQGVAGPTGVQGPKGDKGDQGPPGVASIQQDSDTLKALTCSSSQIAEWNGSIWVCANKASGPPGLQGPKGDTGPQGPAGVQGTKGDGPQGVAGQAGVQGPKGEKGDLGPQGLKGNSLWTQSGNNIYYNDGNIGIGTTSPRAPLETAGSIFTSSRTSLSEGIGVELGYDSGNDYSVLVSYDWDSDSWKNLKLAGWNLIFHTEGYDRMVVDNSGNVGIGMMTPQYALDVSGTIRGDNVSPSDERFKQNIQPLENALTKLTQLRGVSFEWKDKQRGTGTQIGLIAQEVEKVLPELVLTDGEGYKSIAYSKLTSVLIEAIKEQQRSIDEKSATITVQQEKMASLEAMMQHMKQQLATLNQTVNTLKATVQSQ